MTTRFDPAAIRRLRQEQGLSAEQLARRADVTLQTVYQVETGAQKPSADTLAKILTGLGVPSSAVFTEVDDDAPVA
jgi:transcriptional regulator with XRE-family HTH domain